MPADITALYDIIESQVESMSPLEELIGYVPDWTYFWMKVEEWRRDPHHQDFSFCLTLLRTRFKMDGTVRKSYQVIADQYKMDYQTARNRVHQATKKLSHHYYRQVWTNPLSNVWLYA